MAKPKLEYLTECFETKAPELINHLYLKVKELSQEISGLSEEEANRLAVCVGMMVVEDFGGAMMYIPKSIQLPLSGRDLEIFYKFNGRNHNELAHEFKVSVPYVYQIIKRVKKEEIAKRQMDMFK